MIIIDTSVWISFFKGENKALEVKNHIIENNVILHPFILGELLLGGVSSKTESLILSLPTSRVFEYETIFEFIKKYKIQKSGLGWVDVNIIASAMGENYKILTFDKKLSELCRKFHCSY